VGENKPGRPRDQLANLAGLAAATGQAARVEAARRRVQTVRLTDAERETCTAHLAEQYALGRIDRDELEERMDLLNQASVHADLASVFAALPMPPLYNRVRTRPPRWPWALGAVIASLAVPFLMLGAVLLVLGRESAAVIFAGPALVWMLLSARWAYRRTRP
jgi:uncharacterized protein DUF1707